jgi:hypothetical protein
MRSRRWAFLAYLETIHTPYLDLWVVIVEDNPLPAPVVEVGQDGVLAEGDSHRSRSASSEKGPEWIKRPEVGQIPQVVSYSKSSGPEFGSSVQNFQHETMSVSASGPGSPHRCAAAGPAWKGHLPRDARPKVPV